MRKKITICCNNADEAAYIKKETERINLDSEKKIESFTPNTPNLNRLKSFLNNLADRKTTVTDFISRVSMARRVLSWRVA